MSYLSKIEWCHHTFNPWWGCAKVPGDPACHHCYAEAWAKRTGFQIWGQSKPRRELSDKHWREPLKWARGAKKAGERQRVFCASMADVFEDRRDLDASRERLWGLIDATPELDWLLLTKRPENIGMLEVESRHNVWLGTTAVTQKHYDQRVPTLLEHDAAVHFVSMEPLMEPIDLMLDLRTSDAPRIEWVILGGESGGGARDCHEEWISHALRQCGAAKVPAFVKQLGARPVRDGTRLKLESKKGGNPEEWAEALRVREFPIPQGAAA